MYKELFVKDGGVLKMLALTIADKSNNGYTDVQKVLTEIIPYGTIVKTENIKMTTSEIQALVTGYDFLTGEIQINSISLVAQIDATLVIEKEPDPVKGDETAEIIIKRG